MEDYINLKVKRTYGPLTFTVTLRTKVSVEKEGKWYVATAESIGRGGIVSQGTSKNSALKNLKEAAQIYVSDMDAILPFEISTLNIKAKNINLGEVGNNNEQVASATS